MDTALKDQIPTFEKGDKAVQEVGLSNWSALTSGPGIRTWLEVAVIVLVAVVIIGGAELLLRLPQGAAIHPAEAEPDRHGAVHRMALHLAASR